MTSGASCRATTVSAPAATVPPDATALENVAGDDGSDRT
jgi:hypothetical protein